MAHAVPLRSRARWPDFTWPAIALVATLAVGLPIEASAYPGDTAAAAADLAVAVAFVVAGVALWLPARQGDLSGPLMVVTGAAWLVGGLADELALLHRGPLVQLLVASPSGRPRTAVEWTAVIAGYALCVVPEVARGEAATAVLAIGLAGVAVGRWAWSGGVQRRARAVPATAAVAISSVLIAGELAGPAHAATVLWLYEAVLFAVAVAVFLDLRWGAWTRSAVTSLVIDLGDRRSGSLTAVLARAVGDPTLVVGYSIGDGRYVDERGRSVALPGGHDGRAVTTVQANGAPAAVLVHDPTALDWAQLSDAVVAAVRLALDNVRLQSDIRARVREVEASRGRLLHARDGERRRLERRLQAGVGGRLDAAAELLAELEDNPDELLAALPGELESTRAEVGRFAAGLHPADLDLGGLAEALAALAARTPIPVDVSVECGRLASPLEAGAWFVCSEGLANVVKHSGASAAAVTVRRASGRVVVTVDDGGRGGADPSRGRGLRGLAARVEALGGRLEVAAPPGGGTRLRATLLVEEGD